VVPDAKKLAINLDRDPAIVLNGQESAVPILRLIILPGQFRLDEVGLMARLIQCTDGVIAARCGFVANTEPCYLLAVARARGNC
jgi:hypothetical protein